VLITSKRNVRTSINGEIMPHIMPHIPAKLWRIVFSIIATAVLLISLCSCGGPAPRSSYSNQVGPGGIALGQQRADIETKNDGWKVCKTEQDGTHQVITYKDWHWSLSYGLTHGAEYHRVTYNPSGVVVAWSTSTDAPTP
jgi:hypothetical protein